MAGRLGVFTCAVLLAAGTSFSQPGPEGQQMHGGKRDIVRMRGRMAEILNLSDAQKKDFAKLRIEMARKNTPLQSQIRLARLEIQQAMLADKPDRAQIEKSMRQVSDLQLQIKLNGLDHLFAMKNVLTPEQLKIWKDQRGNQGMQRRKIRIFRGTGPMGEALDVNPEALGAGDTDEIALPDEEEIEEEVGGQ
jgi:Spy/CpxP family protein refolding chaperone